MTCLTPEALPLAAAQVEGCPLCAALEYSVLSECDGKSLRRCLTCGGSYVFPQPSAGEAAAHFEQCAILDEMELKRKFEVNRQRVLSHVASYIQRQRERGAILDVGCATGLFLSCFFPASKWQKWGLELSPAAAQKAVERGIHVPHGDVHRAQFSENLFDIITVLDAFYYFPSPHAELSEFHRILRSDGLLLVELPLATSRIWRKSQLAGMLSRRGAPILRSSDHLFYYTPKSIALLLERSGFRVEAIVPLPGNRQAGLLRDLTYRAYSVVSVALHFLSRSAIFLGPRFLVVAGKA